MHEFENVEKNQKRNIQGIADDFKKEIPALKEFLKNILINTNKIIFKKNIYYCSVFMNIFEVFILFQ